MVDSNFGEKNNALINEICDKITKLSKKNNFNDWTYHYKGKNIREKSFKDIDHTLSFQKR